METTQEPPRPGTKADLERRLAAAEGDLRIISERMYSEAVRRGWCSDYEYFVRHTNQMLTQPWLTPRPPTEWCDICQRYHA